MLHGVSKGTISGQDKKLSATISKRNLPTMDYKVPTDNTLSATLVSQKSLAAAQRSIGILTQRGMSMEFIYSHDILPSSIIFEGDVASKPEKSKLMIELKNC